MQMSQPLADWVIDRIESGESQADIAKALCVSPATLCVSIGKWCDDSNVDDATRSERAKLFARARLASAEAWLDRGLTVLHGALDKGPNSYDASAARAYAQECARRAAIRNPAYRDKADVTLANPPGETFKTVSVTPEEAAAIYREAMK